MEMCHANQIENYCILLSSNEKKKNRIRVKMNCEITEKYIPSHTADMEQCANAPFPFKLLFLLLFTLFHSFFVKKEKNDICL